MGCEWSKGVVANIKEAAVGLALMAGALILFIPAIALAGILISPKMIPGILAVTVAMALMSVAFAHLVKVLAENKVKKGVITTDSGLQYEVITEGSGDKALPTSKIKIHYHGTTIDGQVFDSSVDRKEPIDATPTQFIAGFSEGLLLMNKGAKYRLYQRFKQKDLDDF